MIGMDLQPAAGEAPPHHQAYIDLVRGEDLVTLLARQAEETSALLFGVDAARGRHAYAPGKWTLNDLVLHVVDTERIFAYRALWFARGDQQPLPGFEQDAFTASAGAADRTLPDLVAEFQSVRAATRSLFQGFSPAMLTRTGTASGNRYSVRAIAAIIAGHERHHMRIVRERYL